ncbi:MAG: BrnT family toxin [Anaerolineae bacterium]|nr:BrnT family toxin [Anaerolineae bacterium]
MAQYRFWWDENNIEHIANHGVEPYEAEEVVTGSLRMLKAGSDRYAAYGQTDNGRYLLVVFAPKSENRMRVITARDLTAAEKRQLRRRRK